MDEDPHGSSHRWPLIAETRELASAINSASHAASTVGRKGDCKGSLVTEHCVTQVYVAAPRVLPASPFVFVSREGYTRLPVWRTIRSFSSREHRDPSGDNQEQTPLCPPSIAPRLDFSLEGIQFGAAITSHFNSPDIHEF